MKRAPRPSTPPKPCGSLERQLSTYALAAGAAGIGMLALAPWSEAKVVYTPTRQVIRPKTSYNLDLNLDGFVDFGIVNEKQCNFDSCSEELLATPLGLNGVEGTGYALALKCGAHIGPNHPFSGQLMWGYSFGGPWYNVRRRYLGLKFQIGGGTHFGWARLNMTFDPYRLRIKAVLTGYAYETVPDKPVIAGNVGPPKKTGEPDVSIEPASLGHLALGASGMKRPGAVTAGRQTRLLLTRSVSSVSNVGQSPFCSGT